MQEKSYWQYAAGERQWATRTRLKYVAKINITSYKFTTPRICTLCALWMWPLPSPHGRSNQGVRLCRPETFSAVSSSNSSSAGVSGLLLMDLSTFNKNGLRSRIFWMLIFFRLSGLKIWVASEEERDISPKYFSYHSYNTKYPIAEIREQCLDLCGRALAPSACPKQSDCWTAAKTITSSSLIYFQSPLFEPNQQHQQLIRYVVLAGAFVLQTLHWVSV